MISQKVILLKYINSQINNIEKRNPDYLNNKKWQKLKRIEQKLYNEPNEEQAEK